MYNLPRQLIKNNSGYIQDSLRTSLQRKKNANTLSFSREMIEEIEKMHATYIQKHLKDAKGNSLQKTPLGNLYKSLMDPFKSVESIDFHIRDIDIKEIDKKTSKQTAHLINWAYNRRYKISDGKYIPLALHNSDTKIKTFVATIQIGKEEVVLSTMSVVQGGEVEIFELFNMPRSFQRSGKNMVELKRFANHPIFDLLAYVDNKDIANKSKEFSQLIIRKLWKEMGNYMKENSMTPYYILAPHVKDWFDAAGIGPEKEISRKIRLDSPKYKELLAIFPHYWEKNPAVYHAPHFPKK